MLEALAVDCGACGATTRLAPHETASRCAFCDAPLVIAPSSRKVLAPQALLPFQIDVDSARDAFLAWLASRWFAPSDLKRRAKRDGLDGVYLPFFTFDAATETAYSGERGHHYYETETYVAEEDGKRVTKTRRVLRTRWEPCTGVVGLAFDDVLVLASKGLPEGLVRRLEPWDLRKLVPYSADFLSGYRAECDQRGLRQGFEECKRRLRPEIEREVESDIGGDEQRIRTLRTAWTGLTYKHVLLPVWVGAFRYGDAVYRVVINAQTGETQGERPWSYLKIGVTVALFAAVATGLWYLFQ